MRSLLDRASAQDAKVAELAAQVAGMGPDDRKPFLQSLQRLSTEQAQLYRMLAALLQREMAMRRAALGPPTSASYPAEPRREERDRGMYG